MWKKPDVLNDRFYYLVCDILKGSIEIFDSEEDFLKRSVAISTWDLGEVTQVLRLDEATDPGFTISVEDGLHTFFTADFATW